MDLRVPNYTPEGWTKLTKNKRTVFKTPPPGRILIQNKKMLLDYQKTGRFMEANAEMMDFRLVQLTKDVCDMETSGKNSPELMEVDDDIVEGTNFLKESDVVKSADVLEKRKMTPAAEEKMRIELGTQRLFSNPENPVNHSKELEKAAEILNEFMLATSNHMEIEVDVDAIKEKISKAENGLEILDILKSSGEVYQYFSMLDRAKGLSELINLPVTGNSPLVGWPTSLSSNIYSEIIKLAKKEAEGVLAFLCALVVPKDQPVGKEEVVRVADLFSTLAHTVSKKQNALAKLKSIVMQAEGLTSAGLDRMSRLRGTECSATLSRGRHLLAELGESSFRSRIKQGNSFTITCDNLNLQKQNMTQSIIILEEGDTGQLSNIPLAPHQFSKLFDKENFILKSPQNLALLEHLKYAVAVIVGNILGDNVEEAGSLKKCLPKTHTKHMAREIKVPAEVFIPPPEYLNEMDNAEFFSFCIKKQSEFLFAVAESVEKKESFLADLKLVMCSKVLDTGVLETNEEIDIREKAERRIHEEVNRFGRWIGFGDALTFKQFHFGAKSLAEGNCTAFERLEFLSHFRLALFHAKLNKIYMDYPVVMPRRSMMEDEGTMAELVAIAGVRGISSEEKVISTSFEKHDQLEMCVGHLYLFNMFRNFIKDDPARIKEVINEASAVEFVLGMLSKYDVEYYYDPEKESSTEQWDDPANYGRDLVARVILSEVFDAGEAEEDSVLLRALRLTMLVYFLNRKFKKQDSKYAAFLFLDEVMEQQASLRDRERMSKAACVNPSGGRGGGLFT